MIFEPKKPGEYLIWLFGKSRTISFGGPLWPELLKPSEVGHFFLSSSYANLCHIESHLVSLKETKWDSMWHKFAC